MKRNPADIEFSFFIRLTAADDNGNGQCVTCGKFGAVKYMDNGHYVGRQHEATRYSEKNCSLQCKSCNKWEEGFKVNHRAHLVKLHGEKAVLLLEASKRDTTKRSKNDIKLIAAYYKKENEKLLKQKGVQKWW
jgi:hypothetical protein